MNDIKRYTFLRVLSRFGNLSWQIFAQWRLYIFYGFAITVLSALFGRWSFSCQRGNTGPWCYIPTDNIYIMFGFLAVFYCLAILTVGAFVYDFQRCAIKNGVFKLGDAFSFNKTKLKTMAFVFGIFAGFIIPIVVAMYIINKPANPDYRIEFCYFVVMFIMFMIPLLIIRLSAGIAYFLNDGKFPARKIFQITFGRSYIPLIMFLFLIIFALSLNIRSMGYFNYLTQEHHLFSVVVLTDFADSFLRLVCLGLFLLFFEAQYLQMEEEIQMKEALAISEEETAAETPDEPETKSRKAAGKKKNKRKAAAKSATTKQSAKTAEKK